MLEFIGALGQFALVPGGLWLAVLVLFAPVAWDQTAARAKQITTRLDETNRLLDEVAEHPPESG